ncbi:hypothetical protein ACVWYF_000043 [Hymenobacter sp. UYAg731]
MRILVRIASVGLALVAGGLLSYPSRAQTTSIYDLRLLKAQIVDTVGGTDVVAYFSVTAAERKDFPPVLSMGITHRVNNEPARRLDIMHSGGKVRLVIYGPTIAEKDPQAYALIKDQIEKLPEGDFQILAFYFRDVTQQQLSEMTLTYGLWEKLHQERRTEQDFHFSFD